MLPMLKRLLAPAPSPLGDEDARLALAALLVRLARTDGNYEAAESREILAILSRRYTLDAASAAALLQQAETVEANAPDTVRFTRAIKDAVAYEDREKIIQAMWQVALADGVRDDDENRLLRLVANLIGVSDRDSALMRQRVEAANR